MLCDRLRSCLRHNDQVILQESPLPFWRVVWYLQFRDGRAFYFASTSASFLLRVAPSSLWKEALFFEDDDRASFLLSMSTRDLHTPAFQGSTLHSANVVNLAFFWPSSLPRCLRCLITLGVLPAPGSRRLIPLSDYRCNECHSSWQ
jgi:hypothetical protein